MGAQVGRECKVALGASQILGLGTWTISGVDIDVHEDTEFGDTYKTFLVGLRESGTVAFDGFYDPADSTDGQIQLRTYWGAGTLISSLRFYIDANSYWNVSTGATDGIYITSWDISSDKAGIMLASFTGKISGAMKLV